MRILIYPYKLGSVSSKKLGYTRLRPFGRYRARYKDLVINWGNSTIPIWYSRVLNWPEKVATATNKLETFKKLQENEVGHPEWTTEKQLALEWIQQGHEVYARCILTGNSGSGIVVSTTTESLVDAPLYTKRVKAKYEYRVHVFNGNVIDYQQKKRRHGIETTGRIRNHGNGYIFARNDVVLPEVVANESIKAVQALGLDFGAVDIGYVERDNKAFVYEVNTAPGIEGTTVSKYKEAIETYYTQRILA